MGCIDDVPHNVRVLRLMTPGQVVFIQNLLEREFVCIYTITKLENEGFQCRDAERFAHEGAEYQPSYAMSYFGAQFWAFEITVFNSWDDAFDNFENR